MIRSNRKLMFAAALTAAVLAGGCGRKKPVSDTGTDLAQKAASAAESAASGVSGVSTLEDAVIWNESVTELEEDALIWNDSEADAVIQEPEADSQDEAVVWNDPAAADSTSTSDGSSADGGSQDGGVIVDDGDQGNTGGSAQTRDRQANEQFGGENAGQIGREATSAARTPDEQASENEGENHVFDASGAAPGMGTPVTPKPTSAPGTTATPKPTSAPGTTVTPKPTSAPSATAAPQPASSPETETDDVMIRETDSELDKQQAEEQTASAAGTVEEPAESSVGAVEEPAGSSAEVVEEPAESSVGAAEEPADSSVDSAMEEAASPEQKTLLEHVRGIRAFSIISGMRPDVMAGISWDETIEKVEPDINGIDWDEEGKHQLRYLITAADGRQELAEIEVRINPDLDFYVYGMEGDAIVNVGGSFDPMEGVTYGDEIASITADASGLDTSRVGVYLVSYQLTAPDGRVQSAVRQVTVSDGSSAGFEDNTAGAFGSFSTVTDLGLWRLTAYMDTPQDQGPYVGQTASGAPLVAGRTVAVSAATCARLGLRFGDHLMIDGHIYVLEDHGGSAMNNQNWVDIFVDNPIDEYSDMFNRYSEVYLLR